MRYFEDIIRDENKNGGWLKVLLRPLSWVYGLGARAVSLWHDLGPASRRLPQPVISVGNVTVGGAGKTPLVLWLIRRLKSMHLRPIVLTRGYKSSVAGEGNDEVHLIRELHPDIPVIIGRDRYAMAEMFLESHEGDVFIMDDGFQHRRLYRNLDIVAVDAVRGFGNEALLPRGILREPVSALKRADIIVITKTESNPGGENVLRDRLTQLGVSRPVITSEQIIAGWTHLLTGVRREQDAFRGVHAALLASVADPKAFHLSAQRAGIVCGAEFFFPDHHPYSVEDIQRTVAACRDRGISMIVTTHKDAVKLSAWPPDGPDVWVMHIDIEVKDEGHVLDQRIRQLFRA